MLGEFLIIKVVLPDNPHVHMDFFHDLVDQGYTWTGYSKKVVEGTNDVEYTIDLWALD